MYVVKTNDKGKLEWEKNYGTEKRDIGCEVVPLNTGEYILVGGIQEDFIEKTYFAKLDANGNIIWEKKYDYWDFYPIQTNILIQPDNGCIGVGVFQNEFGRSQPKIIEFNHEGDTLWTKSITADPNRTVYIRDIERIENGYVLTGLQYSSAPQYGWILTIDEEGNTCSEGRTYAEPDFEGCDSTVVITDIPYFDINNPYSIQFTPNPANLQTTIHYQIPKDGVLKIYDYQGKELETYPLIANERKFLLKVTDWTSGLYFYKVSIEEKEVDSGKLLID